MEGKKTKSGNIEHCDSSHLATAFTGIQVQVVAWKIVAVAK